VGRCDRQAALARLKKKDFTGDFLIVHRRDRFQSFTDAPKTEIMRHKRP